MKDLYMSYVLLILVGGEITVLNTVLGLLCLL